MVIGGEIAGLMREWGVAATCKKGWKPESPNQDNYCEAVHESALVWECLRDLSAEIRL